MYNYQIKLTNGELVKVKAAEHKQTDEGLFVFYGLDDEVIGEYKDVESWSRQKLKTPQFFAL